MVRKGKGVRHFQTEYPLTDGGGLIISIIRACPLLSLLAQHTLHSTDETALLCTLHRLVSLIFGIGNRQTRSDGCANMEDGDISENEDMEMDEYDEIQEVLKQKQQIITNLEFENTVLKENIKKLENSINELKPRTINNDEYTDSIVKQLLTF